MAMMEATGRQAHPVLGFLAGVLRKKLALPLQSEKADGERFYRVIDAGARRRQPDMPPRFVDPAVVEADIARVRSLSGDALRRRWQAVFARAVPQYLTADLLRRMIANRIQEEAFATLERATLKLLDGPCPTRPLPPGRAQPQDRNRAGARFFRQRIGSFVGLNPICR